MAAGSRRAIIILNLGVSRHIRNNGSFFVSVMYFQNMEKLIEIFTAIIILLVGFTVISVIGGADPSIATSLFSSIVTLLVYVFVIVVFAVVIIKLVSEGV